MRIFADGVSTIQDKDRGKYRIDVKRTETMSTQTQTATVKDEYDEKVLLLSKAFSAISKLAFAHDYSLSCEQWREIDAIEADFDRLSPQELRQRLLNIYFDIKHNLRR